MSNYGIPGDGKNVRTSTTAFGQNLPYQGLEWRNSRDPEYHVYIFNVSSRTFTHVGKHNLTFPGVTDADKTTVTQGDVKDPWKSVDQISGRGKIVKQGKDNERWHYCTSFPQPVLLAKFDDQSSQIGHFEQDAIRYVVDIINPDNLGKTLDIKIDPNQRFSIGNDLSQKGVFFSLSNPPFESDVRGAVDRMEAYYKGLLDRAATLELTDKALLQSEIGSNPDYAYAAEYFGKAVAWRPNPQRSVECPNCGEQKPAGRLFHMASFGVLCVEQTEKAWKSAVNSGVKRPDDVPEEYRPKVEPKVEPVVTK